MAKKKEDSKKVSTNVDLKKSKKTLKKGASEFKEFIMRGNVLDLAVGVIIGGAFGKIVTSLVNDILMPVVGVVIGGLDFTNLSITFGDAKIMYGSFVQQIIDFLIISLCIFLFVKAITKLTTKKEKEEKPGIKEVPKAADILLLEEIRDLLKENKK